MENKYNITIPLKLTYDPARSSNKVFFKIADMIMTVRNVKDEEIGSIAACIGGGIELVDEKSKRRFFIDYKELWSQFESMLLKEKK